MHLIVLENQPTVTRGGQERSLFELCQGLHQRGHQITLIYTQSGDLLPRYATFCQQLIQIHRYECDRRNPREVWQFLQSLWSAHQITSSSKNVIFSNQYNETFFGSVLAFLKRSPLVCYLRIPPLGFNLQRRLGLKGVNQFIAVSHQTKSDWTKHLLSPQKVTVIHNGISPERFAPPLDLVKIRSNWNLTKEEKIIAYAGRIDPEKGIETLIEAFAVVFHQYPQAKLILAGKPLVHFNPKTGQECPAIGEQYLRSLQDLANRLGVSHAVQFLGHVTNPAEVYQASDLSVLPSLWSEPFGRVVIESMACGTPVVASRVGGIPEILTGEFQQGLFEAGNVNDLADKLLKLIDWRSQNPQLGQRCRNHVLAHFSLEQTLDELETLLSQTLKSKRSLKPNSEDSPQIQPI